ncbi:MAG TPA: hypothetical protein VFO91_19705 [Anaerolineales bacterium]|nr:hypothetical protein [Anaerolineales bacterium]
MNKIDIIFEKCLEQIQSGDSTLEECVARYPEHAPELTSLLRTSSRLARAGTVMPSPVFKARTRTELNAYIQSHPRGKRPVPFVWRLTFNAVTTLLAFFILGTAIAQRALPGDTLFPWKLTSERVWRAVSIDRLATDLTLSNRRVRELVRVYDDEGRRARAVENYQQMLVRFKADQDVRHQERIIPVLRTHQESLNQLGISIPELDSYFSPETRDGSGEQDAPEVPDPVLTSMSAFGVAAS